MRYSWTTIQTNNLEKSILFYAKVVDLDISRRFGQGMPVEIVFLESEHGSTEIELIRNNNKQFDLAFSDCLSLGFITNNLEETMAKLSKYDFEYDSEIFSPTPHIRFFYAKDPNGVKIQFAELIPS